MENKYFRKKIETREVAESDASQKSIEEIYLGKFESQSFKKRPLAQRVFVYSLATVLFLGLVAIGFWIYLKSANKPQIQEKPSIALATESLLEKDNSITEQKENSSQKEEIKGDELTAKKSPAELKVTVLNGGVVSGGAGKMKEALVEKGYEKAEADNAMARNHPGEVVYYSDEFSLSAKTLAEAMKELYPNIEIKEAQSTEEKSADLVVIMGK